MPRTAHRCKSRVLVMQKTELVGTSKQNEVNVQAHTAVAVMQIQTSKIVHMGKWRPPPWSCSPLICPKLDSACPKFIMEA